MSEPPACISVLDSADGALELVGAHSAAAGGAVAAAVQTSGFPAQPYVATTIDRKEPTSANEQNHDHEYDVNGKKMSNIFSKFI